MASEQQAPAPNGEAEATAPEADGYEPVDAGDDAPETGGPTDEPATPDDASPDDSSDTPPAEETVPSGEPSDGDGAGPPPAPDSGESSDDEAARKKAAEKAAMLARMRQQRARRRAMMAPIWAMVEKAAAAGILLIFLLYAGHAWWVSHRLASFRADVQAEVNKPDGIDKLRFVDDWRVQDVAPGTKRVSRADGKYVVFVWRLPDGKYMVDSVER